MPPKKPATQHPGLVKQPNPAAVQPNQFKVPLKKQLTEKPADWTQERRVVDCERRWLLTGDCKDQRVAGAKKKAAASVQTTFFAGMDFGLGIVVDLYSINQLQSTFDIFFENTRKY
jgi:hypothetical protein